MAFDVIKPLNFKHLTDRNYGRPNPNQHIPVQELTRPHVDSFNYMLHEGLTKAVQRIPPMEFALPNDDHVSLFILNGSISSPTVALGNTHAATLKVYPAECRQRGVTYKGRCSITLSWSINGIVQGSTERSIGEIPIMVKSDACNLARLNPAELIKRGEEAEEMGGYFISNGIERIIRMLILPRRNYPVCMSRPSWKNRGKQYTEFGVSIRCVRADQTGVNLVLHYLNNGTALLCISHTKEMFFVPVIFILKAFQDITDKEIYDKLIQGKEDDSFYKGCVIFMLRQALSENLITQSSVLKYIGERFRIKLHLPPWYSNTDVAKYMLKECVCVHLDSDVDKFNLLVFMTKKLFAFAKGECAAESADNPMTQEVLLAGHLYLMVVKEKIEGWLFSLRLCIERSAKKKELLYNLNTAAINDACRHCGDLTKPMEYLMATGNLVSKSGLGLMQASGLTVVADKLNFLRYISHFRCVHRGAFFAQMRTTSVRKLLPEAWGFLCPVHTPDGTPCGLMNHMTATCQMVNVQYTTSHLPKLLCSLGVTPYDKPPPIHSSWYVVLLDGRIIGVMSDSIARDVVHKIRVMKVKGLNRVPPVLEICFVAKTTVASQYPGLFLFTTPARMMRPVKNLALNATEMIGTFEQIYLDICIVPSEAHPGVTTHQELSELSMLSALGCLTPFSDYNQSPRNMYQCQMGKQTMGTPLHAFKHRADNKLYRLQTPQSTIVRPHMYDQYQVDNYPVGTNAVIAVISYTGYDMEDAMILNKGSYERGFAHGTVYKAEKVNLKNKSSERYNHSLIFGCKPGDKRTDGHLDPDGLPSIGAYLQEGDVYYSYINVQTGEVRVEKYKSMEPAYVDHIKVLSNDLGTGELTNVVIMLRIRRNPIIGDKFASRHGQKGICSFKWPVENMPFTESGMTPDILFNPHGYPSRMTIGMMIETMAGKAGALHGECYNATPFQFTEDDPPIDYFGKMLTKAGYNYHGTETMYSGTDGRELEVNIFIGIVYYQRLRHMVSDKYQVRTTGPVDVLTRQPVKGRKRAGGIRFGEMERDALIAHGTAFLLQDRLFNCSDRCLTQLCTKCGSILSPMIEKAAPAASAILFEAGRRWTCMLCKNRDAVQLISVPYVFRYLVAELASMSIKLTLTAK